MNTALGSRKSNPCLSHPGLAPPTVPTAHCRRTSPETTAGWKSGSCAHRRRECAVVTKRARVQFVGSRRDSELVRMAPSWHDPFSRVNEHPAEHRPAVVVADYNVAPRKWECRVAGRTARTNGALRVSPRARVEPGGTRTCGDKKMIPHWSHHLFPQSKIRKQ